MSRDDLCMTCTDAEENMILAVSALIFNELGQFLILRRSSDDDFLPEEWEVPGGEVEFGESVVDALFREIREECGFAIDVGFPLFVTTYFTDGSNKAQCFEIFYLCRMKDSHQEMRLSTEHSAYRWVSFTELPDIRTTPSTKELIGTLASHPLVKIAPIVSN